MQWIHAVDIMIVMDIKYLYMQWIQGMDTYNRMPPSSRKGKLLIHTATWVNHKIIMLRERSQTKKSTYLYSSCVKLLENQN